MTDYHTVWGGDVAETDLLQDVAKVELAKEEGGKYMWGQIPESDFLTLYYPEKDECFVVRNLAGRAGCSCKYFKESGTACEHLIALKGVNVSALPGSPDWLTGFLNSTGWVKQNGRECPPAKEMAATPGTPKEPTPAPTPEPIKEKVMPVVVDEVKAGDLPKPVVDESVKVVCPHCKLQSIKKSQAAADGWLVNHVKVCGKNPANAKTQEPVPTPEPEKPKPKAKPKPVSTKMTKTEETTTAVSADVVKMPTDGEFQRAQVQRALEGQGSFYKVGGKPVPDSAAVQNYAVYREVSVELLAVEQTTEYAKAIVRAHRGDLYADASVILRRDILEAKFMIDLAEKHPEWVSGWTNGQPEFYLNQKVTVGEKVRVLGLYVAGACIDKWMFAGRDAETKACRRAEVKVLGMDWREDDETQSEVDEMQAVADSQKGVK